MLCTCQMWQVFDASPIRRSWQIVKESTFRDQLATPADQAYVDHQRLLAKVFKSIVTIQVTIRSQTCPSNIMPVEATLQYEYDSNGIPFAMWGYTRVLRPKMFGLAVRLIQAKQADDLHVEQAARDKQMELLTRSIHDAVKH